MRSQIATLLILMSVAAGNLAQANSSSNFDIPCEARLLLKGNKGLSISEYEKEKSFIFSVSKLSQPTEVMLSGYKVKFLPLTKVISSGERYSETDYSKEYPIKDFQILVQTTITSPTDNNLHLETFDSVRFSQPLALLGEASGILYGHSVHIETASLIFALNCLNPTP